MFDLELRLANRPGELARFGEAMGKAGLSIEGGGVFSVGGEARAHFLFHDGEAAKAAAERAGLEVIALRKVLVRKLKQGTPGQLGAIARALADAGVNIETQYSDHANQLILVVDDLEKAASATRAWESTLQPRAAILGAPSVAFGDTSPARGGGGNGGENVA